MCRLVADGEPIAPLLDRWAVDRALPAATELVVQTTPAAAGFAAHLRTLRSTARTVRGAGETARSDQR